MTKRFDNAKKFHALPLRMKLFWYLAAFFMFIIMLLWIFQVVLMDSFYKSVTVKQLKKSAARIEAAATTGNDIDSAAYDIATQTGFCVSVYMIKDNSGTQVADAHVKNGCFIHTLISGEELNRIYSNTGDSGGQYVGELLGDDNTEDTSILYSSLVDYKEAEYLILFNTEAFPVGATASTITVQLSLITFILLIGAAILAIIVSRKITHPVSGLCLEAEKLAVGNYNLSFEVTDIDELNQLSDTLRYAASELARSDRMQKELVANITHDLRTPLTMISGYSEVMRDIPGEIKAENMQVIIDESARLSALVNDVLEVSKAQTGHTELKRAIFCLTDSVKAVVHRYGVMMSVKGYNISYESDGTPATVNGDENKLIQAVCNLLNNAVNFAGEDKRVIVRQTVKDGICRTEVTDFGAGIPTDELENIWDRYYRARDIQNKGVSGSGLGLSIVKHIMLMHDAAFGVISTPGSGSTFWFEIRTE